MHGCMPSSNDKNLDHYAMYIRQGSRHTQIIRIKTIMLYRQDYCVIVDLEDESIKSFIMFDYFSFYIIECLVNSSCFFNFVI